MEIMENSVEKTINKTTNALAKELEVLNEKELHDLFIFFYQINHQNYNTIPADKFIQFLGSFKSNPFRIHEDKTSRKEFPTEWAGLVDDELEQVTGITGARFCHSTRFLVSCDSLETALKLIDKALSSEINKEQ
jgi:hypothetical protein